MSPTEASVNISNLIRDCPPSWCVRDSRIGFLEDAVYKELAWYINPYRVANGFVAYFWTSWL